MHFVAGGRLLVIAFLSVLLHADGLNKTGFWGSVGVAICDPPGSVLVLLFLPSVPPT